MDASGIGGPWARHRTRAQGLGARYPFAAQVLTLYLALLDVWDEAWESVRAEGPDPSDLPHWTVERVVPRLVKATEAAGPELLAKACADLVASGDLAAALARWLAGADLPPVERYLARAALTGPLVALGALGERGEQVGVACAADRSERGGRRCPYCGGAPQLAFRTDAGDGLVSGRRSLMCSRCALDWSHSASACVYCGEMTGSRRTVYAERHGGPAVRGYDPQAFERRGKRGRPASPDLEPAAALEVAPEEPTTFPHLHVDACATCQHYVIDVDLSRDPLAVPEVDELVALPLDLYAAEQGLTKTTPNLMGF